MGKNYATEVEQLPATYRWAVKESLGALVEFVRSCSSRPLLAVGSGGSYSSASFASYLHESATGCLARAMTPLEVTATELDLRDLGTLLLTASGRNPDIRAAFDTLAGREPRSIGVLATRPGGPLSETARGVSRTFVSDFALPVGKDGYLATNSLVATLVLLTRAYVEAGLIDWSAPNELADLVESHDGGIPALLDRLTDETRNVLKRPNLLVLHSPTMKPAAVDIESRFTEAAFGPVLTSDFRNFAHGRHLWLDRLGDSTAILSLVTDEAKPSATSLLKLIPRHIPVVSLSFPGSVSGAISGIVTSILLAACAGRLRGVDPGQPHVPEFGRRMYNLKSLGRRRTASSGRGIPPAAAVAIQRKACTSIARLERRGLLPGWKDAYRRFLTYLCKTRFAAVAFDYDGTLCDSDRRFQGVRPEVAKALKRLLDSGLPLAVATGRGKSVREQLQQALPRRHWDRVIVGYYNGSEVSLLADDDCPATDAPADPCLAAFQKALVAHPAIGPFARVTVRPNQVTVEPASGTDVRWLWEVAQGVAQRDAPGMLRVLRSDHSVDVVRSRVSKADTVRALRQQFDLDPDRAVLCVGDRGRWPGNDCDLLSGRGSLSVDETSSDPGTCWNVARPGVSHVDATLEYLSLLDIEDAACTFSEPRLGEMYS